MADGFSLKFNTSGVTRAVAEVNRDMDRATAYGLRRVGAVVRSQARSRAPVYTGPARKGVIAGELKKSIKTSKRVKNDGVYRTLTVGPSGQVRRDGGGAYGVPLYRRRQEAAVGFMKGGHDAGMATAGKTLEAAWAKSLGRK